SCPRANSTTRLFFSCSAPHPDLHSFPTRRSSDLDEHLLGLYGGQGTGGDLRADNRRDVASANFDHLRILVVDLCPCQRPESANGDRKSTRLNSSHVSISYAVFCLKKKKNKTEIQS